jgi:hypothetical protein
MFPSTSSLRLRLRSSYAEALRSTVVTRFVTTTASSDSRRCCPTGLPSPRQNFPSALPLSTPPCVSRPCTVLFRETAGFKPFDILTTRNGVTRLDRGFTFVVARPFASAGLHPVGCPSKCPRCYSCNGQFMRQTPFSLRVLPSLLGAPNARQCPRMGELPPRRFEEHEGGWNRELTRRAAKGMFLVLCDWCLVAGAGWTGGGRNGGEGEEPRMGCHREGDGPPPHVPGRRDGGGPPWVVRVGVGGIPGGGKAAAW